MFWDKEKVLAIAFNSYPEFRDRKTWYKDEKVIIKDKKGNLITLKGHKKLYPYKLVNEVICQITTNLRTFKFTIPKGYCWNGADIPSILWVFVGSKDSPEFKVPSLIHDFLLEFKEYILNNVLKNEISFSQYRRLTTLVFRQCLKDYGTKTVKSNIMAAAVAAWQFVSPQWWDCDTNVESKVKRKIKS